MAFLPIGSLNYWQRGFGSVLLFYALGLGIAIALAQFMPVADVCNPGVPFLAELLTLLLGAIGAGAALVAFLLGCRTEFVKGFLVAQAFVLVGIAVLLLIAGAA